MNDLELFAIPGMVGPFPAHLDDLTWRRGHEVAHNVHQITLAVDLELGDREAVFFVRVGDPLDLALEVGKGVGGRVFHGVRRSWLVDGMAGIVDGPETPVFFSV